MLFNTKDCVELMLGIIIFYISDLIVIASMVQADSGVFSYLI
jgi:hypothetical protein